MNLPVLPHLAWFADGHLSSLTAARKFHVKEQKSAETV